MTRFKILIFFFLMAYIHRVYGQIDFRIGNVIEEKTNIELENVIVEVYKNNSLIFTCKSDISGLFKIPTTYYQIDNTIQFKSLNYFNLNLEIKNIKSTLDPFLIKLKPKSISLKEVLIKGEKRYRDTTKFDLSNEDFEKSFMIDDFFNTHGFYKNNEGILFYKGKTVNELKVNSHDFFKNSNNEIYKLLPALILNGVEIIETNIDSLTNTTLQTPTLQVNVKLKDKYTNGRFGNLDAGLGTLNRFIIDANLFGYKKNRQISISQNSNNINIKNISLNEPILIFSANGNNANNNITRVTYSNIYSRKIELDFLTDIKTNSIKNSFESYRKDENLGQESITTNSSYNKQFEIENLGFKINYKIDSLKNFKSKHQLLLLSNKYLDTNNYNIKTNKYLILSRLTKHRTTTNKTLINDFAFQALSKQKKGRYLTLDLTTNFTSYYNTEDNVIDDYSSSLISHNVVNANRKANETTISLKTSIAEPFNLHSYLRTSFLLRRMKIDEIDYSNNSSLNDIGADFAQLGATYQNYFNKNSLNVKYAIDVYKQNKSTHLSHISSIYSSTIDFNFNLNLNSKHNLTIAYLQQPNYPTIYQLTNINRSLDLISQSKGNINLRPEIKKELDITLNLASSTSKSYSIGLTLDRFKSKFGYRIDTANRSQTVSIENLSTANDAQIRFSVSNFGFDKIKLNYSASLIYNQNPLKINEELLKNDGFILSNSIFSNIAISSRLKINPILFFSYNKFNYEKGKTILFSLTYSDKLTLNVLKFNLNISPIINYNKGVNNQFNWAVNGALKRTIFNANGSVWLKAYDIFNSFNYANNIFTPGYIQTINYANLQRYFLLGLSFKFNNMNK